MSDPSGEAADFGPIRRPADLPDYERPPIDEVAISLQFAPLAAVGGAVVSQYREGLKAEFPKVQYQPRLPPLIIPGSPVLSIQGTFAAPFQMPSAPTLDRTWLVSPDESELIQIQSDRFAYNWRKREEVYPHFEALAGKFWQRYSSFADLFKEAIEPQFLEISYINWVPDSSLPSQTFFQPMKAGDIALKYASSNYEPVNWQANYLIRSESLNARLNVAFQNGAMRAVQTSLQRGVVLTLQFVAPVEPRLDAGLVELMSLGRNIIVHAFTELTTSPAHEEWGRK